MPEGQGSQRSLRAQVRAAVQTAGAQGWCETPERVSTLIAQGIVQFFLFMGFQTDFCTISARLALML